MYAPRGLKIVSRLLQDGLLEPILTKLGPKLAPSWLKLGPCWTQVGSSLAQVGPMLPPVVGPQPPLGQPKHFRTPSLLPLGLPNSHLHPTKPKLDPKRASQTSNLVPRTPTWPPKLSDMGPKGSFQGSKSYCSGPAEWGA